MASARATLRAEADRLLAEHGLLPLNRMAKLVTIERKDGTVGSVLTFEHIRHHKPRKIKLTLAQVKPQSRAERNAARLVAETESARLANEKRARIVRAYAGLAYKPGFAG